MFDSGFAVLRFRNPSCDFNRSLGAPDSVLRSAVFDTVGGQVNSLVEGIPSPSIGDLVFRQGLGMPSFEGGFYTRPEYVILPNRPTRYTVVLGRYVS